MNTKYLTEDGLKLIKSELDLLKVKRSEIAKRIEEAKSLGDLSENADYIKAKEEQSFNEGRIKDLEQILSNFEIIKHRAHPTCVHIGSTVGAKSDNGKELVYTIVGSNEADPTKGLISNESPLGVAFLGKRAGESVEVTTPAGKKIYKIVSIK